MHFGIKVQGIGEISSEYCVLASVIQSYGVLSTQLACVQEVNSFSTPAALAYRCRAIRFFIGGRSWGYDSG
jgi:hypothetical protein